MKRSNSYFRCVSWVMSPSPGCSRRVFVTFSVGILFGFGLTYLAVFSSNFHEAHTSKKRLIPADHAEFDALLAGAHQAGPAQEVKWNDFEHDHSHGDHTVADLLYKEVRVLCWVMTSPGNLYTKAKHVKATWGRRCNKLLFMSSVEEKTLPVIKLNVGEGRDNLWGKTKAAYEYVYKHHLQDADWFFKADDDTYAIVENLRILLKNFNATDPVYLGRKFKPYVKQGYMSGGAGYVLSKKALEKFVKEGLSNPSNCRPDNGGAEDLEMGFCMQGLHVKAGDSRDNLHRETFHPFLPEHMLIPNLIPRDNWIFQYTFFPHREGPDCCSDHAITFHYITPNMMYVMEYLIYHLKPFGLNSRLVLPHSGQQGQAVDYFNIKDNPFQPLSKDKKVALSKSQSKSKSDIDLEKYKKKFEKFKAKMGTVKTISTDESIVKGNSEKQRNSGKDEVPKSPKKKIESQGQSEK